MNNTNEKELFNIQLNSEGAYWILRFCKIVQWLIIVTVAIGVVSIIHNLLRSQALDKEAFLSKPLLRYEYLYEPYLSVVYDLFMMVQLYFFWKFRLAVKNAIKNISTDQFNSAFQYLYRMTRIAVLLVTISFLMNGFTFFLHLKYHGLNL